MKIMISTVMLLFFCVNASADSLWSCMGTAKSRILEPERTRQVVESSFIVELYDDGGKLSGAGGPYEVPGEYLLNDTRRKAYIYDDLEYVEWLMYDSWPEGFWGLFFVGQWSKMTFNKPIESATTAYYRAYASIQVFNPNDVLIRVVSKSKAKCIRIQ